MHYQEAIFVRTGQYCPNAHVIFKALQQIRYLHILQQGRAHRMRREHGGRARRERPVLHDLKRHRLCFV